MIALGLLAAAWGSTLHGDVVTPDGDPLRNATVVLYDRRLNYRHQISDEEGAWRFDDLEPGRWRVRVIPSPLDNYQEQWVGGGLQVCEGTLFDPEIDGAPVRVTVPEGASLEGTLTGPDGQPITGAQVSARPVAAPTAFLRAGMTNEAGRFSVRGLAPRPDEGDAVYRLEVTRPGWPTQSLPGTYTASEATAYTIVPGDVQEVGTHALLTGVSVGGFVTGPDGPIESGSVRAYSGSQVTEAPIVGGAWAVIGLPPGEVLAWARADGHATTWWPDEDRPGARVPVLGEGSEVDDLDIDMPAESLLRGRVIGGGIVEGMNVLAYNDDRTVATGAVTDADGRFTIGRLHGGVFTLYAYGGRNGFVEGWVGGATPATYLVPAEGATPELQFELAVGAALTGVARDAATGDPVYGATIHVVSQDTGEARAVNSGRDGAYALRGLPAGTWKVWIEYQHFCGADPGWAPQYYPDQVNPALVGLIRLRSGDVTTWDPALPPDHDHDGMDDDWEREHGLDPTRDDSAEDPDGDGFTNLDEYLLGTDPSAGPMSVGGCAGCGGGAPGSWLLLVIPWSLARRMRYPGARHAP